jgi:DivIVA domain-containing protein
MIDLTPLDVRNKRGDFKKIMRGYDSEEVDAFLELAAERLEALVRENLQLRERTQTLQNQVDAQVGREQAVQDALVTAQELRADIQAQSQREADHVRREADADAKRLIAEAEAESRRLIAEAEAEVRSRLRGIDRRLDHARDSITELERRRVRFLKEFRGLLERELDVVEVEEDRAPYEERPIDLDLGPRGGARAPAPVERADLDLVTLEPTEAAEASSKPAGDAPQAVEATVESSSAGAGAAPDDAASPEPDAVAASGDGSGTGPEATEPPRPPAPPADEVKAVEPPGAAGSDVPEIEPPSADAVTAVTSESESADADVSRRPSSTGGGTGRPSAPPAAVPDEPSTLELELMAGADDGSSKDPAGRFPDVPDLETLLAEAGVEDVKPPKDIAPPPAPGVPRDNVILFDPNDPDRRR